MRLTLQTFLTLDGVMQAPGGPEEDTEGGFQLGGWQFAYGDEDIGAAVVRWFEHADAFLLGRRTYQIFAGYWPRITDPGNPIARTLNAKPKYVASTTLSALDWPGSELLGGDVAGAVQRLKAQPGDELQVHGSGGLAQTLIDNDLIDEYRLYHYPIHVGAGKKLFRDTTRAAALRPTGTMTTRSGVVISTYVPDGAVRRGSYAD
ncbi:MAG TPA: dihydrofolate reductase family protein [Candidatus Dormibacteraeota bacterium]